LRPAKEEEEEDDSRHPSHLSFPTRQAHGDEEDRLCRPRRRRLSFRGPRGRGPSARSRQWLLHRRACCRGHPWRLRHLLLRVLLAVASPSRKNKRKKTLPVFDLLHLFFFSSFLYHCRRSE
ncbi:unnamed protein product, partial [Musa hybrid cultivar]